LNPFINSPLSLKPSLTNHYDSDMSSSCYSNSDAGSVTSVSSISKCDRAIDVAINVVDLNISDDSNNNSNSSNNNNKCKDDIFDKSDNRSVNRSDNRSDTSIDVIEMSLLEIDREIGVQIERDRDLDKKKIIKSNNNNNNNNNKDLESSLDTYLKSLLKKRTSYSPTIKSSSLLSPLSPASPLTKKSNINPSPEQQIQCVYNNSNGKSLNRPSSSSSLNPTIDNNNSNKSNSKEIDTSKYVSIVTSEWDVVLLIGIYLSIYLSIYVSIYLSV
jgi:hypothetical protein